MIICVWAASSPVLIVLMGFIGIGSGRGIGFSILGLALMPAFLIYFLKRSFPLYRVTDCPYCGYHETLKLGRSAL